MKKFNGKIYVIGTLHSSLAYQEPLCGIIKNESEVNGNPSIVVFIELGRYGKSLALLKSLNDSDLDAYIKDERVDKRYVEQYKILIKKFREIREKNPNIEFVPISNDGRTWNPTNDITNVCMEMGNLISAEALFSKDFNQGVRKLIKALAVFNYQNRIRESEMVQEIARGLDKRFHSTFVIVGDTHADRITEGLKGLGYNANCMHLTDCSAIDVVNSRGPKVQDLSEHYTTINTKALWKVANTYRLMRVSRDDEGNERFRRAGVQAGRNIDAFLMNPNNVAINKEIKPEHMLEFGQYLLITLLYSSRTLDEKVGQEIYKISDLKELSMHWTELTKLALPIGTNSTASNSSEMLRKSVANILKSRQT